MTLLTESRAAFVALQALYVEPTEYPVIGLSLHTIPPGYVFSVEKFYRGVPGRSLETFVQHGSLDKPKQDIIHIPFLDAD